MTLEFMVEIAIFALSGVFLKNADYWGEKHVASKGYLSAFVATLCFWYLMHVKSDFSTIIIAIVLSSAVMLKIDRANLIFGVVLLVGLALLLGVQMPNIPLLIGLTALGALDEAFHGRAWKSNIAHAAFRYRILLKSAVIAITILGWLSPTAGLGFLAFDIAYDTTTHVFETSLATKQKTNPLRVLHL